MKLIEDLGVMYNGRKTKRRWGVYECPKCKKHYDVQTSNVKSGKSKMCRVCSAKICTVNHGLSNHPLSHTWSNMKARCYNPNNSHYQWYGGEGTSVCDEWKDDFMTFYTWAIQNGWEPKARLDKDILCKELGVHPKVYSPDTCQFLTNSENCQATRLLNAQNKSGYRGVSVKKSKTINKFIAQISVNGKKHHIGYYQTPEEAAQAYDDYVITHNLKHTRNFSGQHTRTASNNSCSEV